jgi:3-phytase
VIIARSSLIVVVGVALATFASALAATDPIATVTATVETEPVPHGGDAADDPAIWVHPTDPALSVVIGTDKAGGGGLGVYNLDGSQHQFLTDGALNNVDLRYGFPLAGRKIDLVAASDRGRRTVAFFHIDQATRTLTKLGGPPVDLGPGFAPYGFCLYHSPRTGRFYAFVTARGDGTVKQFELADDGRGGVAGNLVRTMNVGSLTEGCVADDVHSKFFISEESTAIWMYGAEPDDDEPRTQIDTTGQAGHLRADIEGLTIYHRGDGGGYLLASSQGDSTFAVYELTGGHRFLKRFKIGPGRVDGVSSTDGIDVVNVALGPGFPHGMLVVQDDANTDPPGHQNFKLLPWEAIAGAGDSALTVDTAFDPRRTGTSR